MSPCGNVHPAVQRTRAYRCLTVTVYLPNPGLQASGHSESGVRLTWQLTRWRLGVDLAPIAENLNGGEEVKVAKSYLGKPTVG